MTQSQRTPAQVVTGEVRLAFPALFVPRPPMKGATSDKEFYMATLLFPKGYDMNPLLQAVAYAAREKWGAKIPPMSKDKNPIKRAEEQQTMFGGLEEGMFFIRTKSQFPPGVVDQRLQKIIDPNLIYPGCYVRADINAFAWSHPTGGKGVSFGLNNIQFLRHGERIDGRNNAADVFEPVAFDPNDDAAAGSAGSAGDAAASVSADDIFGL